MLLETCYYVTRLVLSLQTPINTLWSECAGYYSVQHGKVFKNFPWTFYVPENVAEVFLCVLKCKSCWPCLKCVLLQCWTIIVWGEKNILSRTFVFLIFACWPRRHIDLSKISAGWHTGAVSVSLWPLHFIFHQSIKLMTAQKPFGILYIFCRHFSKMLKHLPESLKWFSLWLFEPSLK